VKPKGQLQKENDSKFLQMLREQKREGKVSESALYEMLQEYMIENDSLRYVGAFKKVVHTRLPSVGFRS